MDKTFDKDGKVSLDFTLGWDIAHALAIQPDGKIVVAGEMGTGACALARFNANGSLDTSFGSGGKVVIDLNPNYTREGFYDVKLQSDGKIVVSGGGFAPSSGFRFVAARFNTSGSLDASFGGTGIVFAPVIPGISYNDAARALLIQPDGRMIVTGYLRQNSPVFIPQVGLLRFNVDGSWDTTFGTGGVALGGQGTGEPGDAVLQPDGKLVVAGGSYGSLGNTGSPSMYAVARFNADGSLDNTFGTGGKVQTDMGPDGEWYYAVALQSDGGIVAAGAHLVRYLGDPPLLAASTPSRTRSATITPADAQPLLAEALARWTVAGFDTSALGNIQLQIANLGGRALCRASGSTITLDDNAAGWGWFVDKTPWEDSGFVKKGNQGEQQRMDLLTALMHEVGHLLGFKRSEPAAAGVMSETLEAGTRLAIRQDADAYFALLAEDELRCVGRARRQDCPGARPAPT